MALDTDALDTDALDPDALDTDALDPGHRHPGGARAQRWHLPWAEMTEIPQGHDPAELTAQPLTRTERRAHERARQARRVLVRVLVVVVAVGVVIGVLLGIQGARVAGQVLKGGGSVLDLVGSGTPMQQDAHGRTSVVVFGTSQDDPAHVAGAAGIWLTDSIQLLVLDQNAKTASMVAIPRDLYVAMPKGCVVGLHEKINAVYECAAGLLGVDSANPPNYAEADAKGAAALSATIGEVTGFTPQYYVHIDYSVVRQAVDAVGGIDVDIVGDGGTGGIFDEMAGVSFPHDGSFTLDGDMALNLCRARGDTGPGVKAARGLSRGDFDRQANQQKVLNALKRKAVSAGTLANPIAVTKLMSALGDHVTTNFAAGEIKSLISLAQDTGDVGIRTVSLTDPDNPVLTTGTAPTGASIVKPVAGLFDYAKVKAYLAVTMAGSTVTASSPATTGKSTSS
jgi:LCP family protein required for cell wall assembly